MSIDDKANKPKRPFGRSLGDFESLSEAEKKLIACAERGEMCKLGEAVPKEPTLDNVIRPELIRFLALGGDETAPVHEKGVQLRGAWIGAAPDEKPRTLDFSGCKLTATLLLHNCFFQSAPFFFGAQGKNLLFDGSELPGLYADQLKLNGNLFLRRVRAKATVRLLGAEITANLECSGGRFEKNDSTALLCDGVRIGGDVFLNLYSGQSPNELHQFHATGQVRFIGATIGGDVDCTGGRFENEEDIALTLERADIGGSVFCNRGFQASGEVRLNAAKITVNLSCDGGRFQNERGRALTCDGVKIDGGVFFKDYRDPIHDLKIPFQAIGNVRLSRAAIGKDLDCSGGRFEDTQIDNMKAQQALLCDGAKISGNIFCSNGFQSIGEVSFIGATVDGDISFRDGRFENKGGMAISCERTNVGGVLFFRDLVLVEGFITFAHAHIATLVDKLVSWPDQSLNLDGFRYDRIDAIAPLDARSRIAWLDKQVPQRLTGDSFALQPWMHLAKVLREQGHFREAAEVDIAREERLRKAGKVGDPKWGQIDSSGSYITFFSSINEYLSCFYHWLHGLLTGYGYQPWRIIYIATFLWLFGAYVFYEGADNGSFAPTNAAAKTLRDECKNQFKSEPIDWLHCSALQKTYPRFSPLAYSLDLILPVVRLGQSAAWTPTWDAVWTQRLVWVEEIFGWVAALTLAAIAAGLVKRKDG